MAHASFTPHLAAFRFYDDDGGEAASTPLAAQDTNITVDLSAGNAALQLRLRVDETGGADGSSTDDYTLQFDRNGTGASDVNGSTSAVQGAGAGLTNDAATTNRAANGIGDPAAGSFVAGEQSTDGIVDGMLLTQNDFTEHVYGLTLIAADLADGDTLDFTLSSPTGIVNSVTPRITVDKSVSQVQSAGAAAETDTGQAATADTALTRVAGLASETVAGPAVSIVSPLVRPVGTAAESCKAPALPSGGGQTIETAPAAETDGALSLTASTLLTAGTDAGVERDSAPGLDGQVGAGEEAAGSPARASGAGRGRPRYERRIPRYIPLDDAGANAPARGRAGYSRPEEEVLIVALAAAIAMNVHGAP